MFATDFVFPPVFKLVIVSNGFVCVQAVRENKHTYKSSSVCNLAVCGRVVVLYI